MKTKNVVLTEEALNEAYTAVCLHQTHCANRADAWERGGDLRTAAVFKKKSDLMKTVLFALQHAKGNA
jgi:hypothetical protein